MITTSLVLALNETLTWTNGLTFGKSKVEICVNVQGTIPDIVPTIESGHIFKLGTKYAETFGVSVLDENGKSRTVVMGSYGIGVERAMATIVETHFDDKGIIWPLAVAPFEVVVTIVQPKDEENVRIGEHIYESLLNLGVEVLLDDRDARPRGEICGC